MTLPSAESIDTATSVERLSTQFDHRLLGVPLEPVRLRWSVVSSSAAASQLGYQIRLRTASGQWRTHAAVVGEQALDVDPGDGALAPREVREYSVRIATADGWTAWSESVRAEGGVPGEFLQAEVIGIPSDIAGPVPVLRREFDLADAPGRAVLRISALGVYDVRVNGERATDGILNPGWTSYQERILLDTLDVTSHLRAGANAISISVADGWYRGRMGFAGRTAIYGDRIGAIAQLEVDGAIVVATDGSWTGGFGQIRSASIYDGSEADLTIVGDASEVGFSSPGWAPVDLVPADPSTFAPRAVAPVRVIAERPMTVATRGAVTSLDSGQNVSGWVRLTVEGRRGDIVTVRHAEVLEPDGALHTAALRTAKATDTYILGEDGLSELEPHFTFHGFRFAEVSGASVVAASAIAISSDLPVRSRFRSSHAVLDRFHENVRWSQLDNFVSLPTDCPQRDERLGWTGDAQAFAPTASTLFDTESFWTSWLRDLEIDQDEDGAVASVVPNIIAPGDMQMGVEDTNTMGRAGWADAATIVPVAVYQAYGSTDLLRTQLGSMRRWVQHLRSRAGADVLLPAEPFQYGDWLDPDAPADKPWAAKVDSLFVANCFYMHSARLLARAEDVLGNADEAAAAGRVADAVASATWDRWGSEAGATQTGAAMCLEFGIVPPVEREKLAATLAAEVRRERGRIATGFLGTPLVLDALSSNGHLSEAFLMLLRPEAPSWLYQVDRGATTVWERWDAIKPDGSIHTGEMDTREDDSMISFNHYAYGAMVDWVYRNVAGLAPQEPGYRVTRVAPRPATALTEAEASIVTSYGEIAIAWNVDEVGTFRAVLRVPFGIEAHLDLPTTAASEVTVDGSPVAGDRIRHGEHHIVVTAASVVVVADAAETIASEAVSS